MALVLADRVREGTNTAGTGTVTLTGAVTGFASFADQIGNGNTTYYTITDGTSWEVGVGTYNAGTLSRDTVLDSSTGSKINFAAGFKDVFVTLPAEKTVNQDANNRVLIPYTSGTTNVGSLNVGNTTSHSDSGVIAGFTASEPLYLYTSLQNTSASNTSYASYAVNDGGHTAYGELGINNSNYSYSAAGFPNNGFSAPLATFVESYGGPLVLGSWDSQKISFIVNGAVNTADAMTIETTGAVTIPTAAVTGGTINNVTIGGTTPAAGTFTTLTAQTENLKGTGENLFIYSQDIANANWSKGNSSISGTLYTAPDATTTANSLIESSATGLHYVQQFSSTLTSGVTYTFSVYFKAGTRAWASILLPSSVFGSNSAYFNLSTGALGSVSGVTAAITSAGNGWYRCSVTKAATATAGGNFVITSATADNTNSYTGDGTSNILLWGVQLEIGSVTNTYVPTTTTAVYGTPTLSFSGVAGLGLQSDGSLYVSPAGTGAIQAQATTSTATGGNARGANAVDWQTARSSAGQVASAGYCVIGGGYANTASNGFSTVSGGFGNSTGYMGAIVGGQSNSATTGQFNAVVGGQSNNSLGYYNFIGAGFTNSGTSGSAVTTQSGTMNGTTAVTLSGSNGSIKVGQYITGTSIAGDTYVAAISGTSLTLSKNASGSSTSTLSFYTPHGVVVGGGNNQATGSYSFIGGGGDAGTAANRNVASGDWSVVVGGRHNTASGVASFVGAGGILNNTDFPNTASGSGASVVGGVSNSASGSNSFVGNGYGSNSSGSYSGVISGFSNTSSGTQSTVIGGAYASTRSINSLAVIGGGNPLNASNGMSQTGILVLARQTTDATATVLCSDNSAASSTNQVILPNNSAYYFRGTVVAGVTGGGNTKGWTVEGVIKRGANAAATTVVGVTVASMYADAGAVTWTIGATADTTNGGLAITFTGQASTTIRCVAKIETTEMTY